MNNTLDSSVQQRIQKKILVVDDEPRLVDGITINLSLEGYDVSYAYTGMDALSKIVEDEPDLVTLDVMMHGMDGFETLDRLRKISDAPVIMLTVMGKEIDKVKGLRLGADDYLTKPFSPRELTARVGAVLRRASARDVPDMQVRVDDNLFIDFGEGTVEIADKKINLRATEKRLLYRLVSNAGHVLRHESLLRTVWGSDYRNQDQYVWLYITHLRQKIEEAPDDPKYILGWRGTGYYFKDFKSNGNRIRHKRPRRGAK